MFILKPKKQYHGRNLKKWYRRVQYALTGHIHLPRDWIERPSVPVPTEKLSVVIDTLHLPYVS